MLSTKFQFIRERGFRGEYFFKSANQKEELPMAPCLLMDRGTEIWWEAPMEGFVLSFLKAE
jgi:hypothetical protein